MFSPDRGVNICVDTMEAAGKLLKNYRMHDAMRVVKTWTNSWATSDRYQEPEVLPCLFGCTGEEDVLEHYLVCPILSLVLRTLRPSTPPSP